MSNYYNDIKCGTFFRLSFYEGKIYTLEEIMIRGGSPLKNPFINGERQIMMQGRTRKYAVQIINGDYGSSERDSSLQIKILKGPVPYFEDL